MFGITICHEGFRYPETVRAAAQAGATVVFHPHFEGLESRDLEAGPPRTEWCGRGGTFHEHAQVCRALENEIYIASSNYALADQPSATCVISPDGALVDRLDYGQVGVLVTDIDLDLATRRLATRFRSDATRVASDPVNQLDA